MTACSRLRSQVLRIFLCLLGLTALLAANPAPAEPPAGAVTYYRAVLLPFYHADGPLRAVVRQYRQENEDRVLVLDPDRFRFEAMSASASARLRQADGEAWRQTPFAKALTRQTAPPYPRQNDGLRHAEAPVAGFFLTADLCPSRRPLDRSFLEALAALPLARPIPITLMVSGLWIERHPEDLAWIKDQISAGKLAVTWGNHTFTHFYDPQAPLEKNFLLRPGTDFGEEALRLERILLEQGLTPAPFFRFPGLVSDQALIRRLRDLSLIPVGADAWLAKGEVPKLGSIILVHGNGNEPEGIRLLAAFLAGQEASFRRGEFRLLPLSEAFASP